MFGAISMWETLLIKYGEGQFINFAYFMAGDKSAAKRFRIKNNGEFVKENAKENTNRGIDT